MRGNCGGTVGELRGNCCQGTARDRPGKGEAEFATNLNARPRAFPISQCCSTQPGPIPSRLQCSNSNIDCRGDGGRPTQATTQVFWQVAVVCACAGAQYVTSRLSMRLSVWGLRTAGRVGGWAQLFDAPCPLQGASKSLGPSQWPCGMQPFGDQAGGVFLSLDRHAGSSEARARGPSSRGPVVDL